MAVVNGNQVKFQKKIFYSPVYYPIFYKKTRWSSIFGEFRLITTIFTTCHVPVLKVVLKFVDTYLQVLSKSSLFVLIWDLAVVFGHTVILFYIFLLHFTGSSENIKCLCFYFTVDINTHTHTHTHAHAHPHTYTHTQIYIYIYIYLYIYIYNIYIQRENSRTIELFSH